MSEIKTPPKRLADLNPEWLPTAEARAVSPVLVEHNALEFDCPCGERCAFTRVYLPITGRSRGSVTWAVESSTDAFDKLTLSPSIHAAGHWHGWIRDGMVISC